MFVERNSSWMTHLCRFQSCLSVEQTELWFWFCFATNLSCYIIMIYYYHVFTVLCTEELRSIQFPHSSHNSFVYEWISLSHLSLELVASFPPGATSPGFIHRRHCHLVAACCTYRPTHKMCGSLWCFLFVFGSYESWPQEAKGGKDRFGESDAAVVHHTG